MAVGQIISRAIATGAIGADQIATGAITAADIPAGEITADKLHQTLDFSTKTFTMANAHVTQAMVTQHQSALSVTESQVSDLQSYVLPNTSPTFTNTTLTGYLAGPASFVIDPAGVGDNTGTVVIAGNLQVDGTQTTINSTTVSIDDLKLSVATDAANSAAANGAGITVGGANANITYTHATTSWDFDKPVNVTGAITATGISQFSDVNIPNNNAIRFGNSQDLQIYHDGSNNYIDATGVGHLYLRAQGDDRDVKIQSDNGSGGLTEYFRADGSIGQAQMFYYGSKKLATTSTGIDVTGTVTSDGLTVQSNNYLDIHDADNHVSGRLRNVSGSNNALAIEADPNNSASNSFINFKIDTSEKMRIESTGHVKFNPVDSFSGLNNSILGSSNGYQYFMGGANGLYLADNANLHNAIGIRDAGFLDFMTGGTGEKMRITSTGNVGIGTSTPTHKLEVAGTTKAEQYLLDAIAKDITVTASDVFVYDTRKDSDGGAWRKRTQHTSWYNETLNTTYRGARKEFPAVAVLAFNTNQELWIYDGDDPDLSLWARYANFTQDSGDTAAITAVNGSIYGGQAHAVDAYSGNGYFQLNFAADYFFSNIVGIFGTYRQGRADGLLTSYNYTTRGDRTTSKYSMPNLKVNDIAVTVLPNAPIDSATGLPIPTIALATNGGVGVIKDDGTVVDITHSASTNKGAERIELIGKQIAYSSQQSGSSTNQWRMKFIDIPSADVSGAYLTSIPGFHLDGRGTTGLWPPLNTNNNLGDATNDIKAFASNKAVGFSNKLTQILGADTTAGVAISNGYKDIAVAYITSDYNTGWQSGDIKLATLSDTDDTDVTGTELVTNGTFASNTTGWTAGDGATVTHQSGRMRVDGNVGTANQAITTVVGKSYTVSADLFLGTSASAAIYISTTASSTQAFASFTHATPANSVTFIATSTTTYIVVRVNAASNTYIEVDNISVRLAEEDRSVNGNGLQVFGTVTKTAVATGADLVAYSGFSTSSNYLQQPYNSDLDFGTGDFSITFWYNQPSQSTEWSYILQRGPEQYLTIRTHPLSNSSYNGKFLFKFGSAGWSITDYDTRGKGWICATFVRNSGVSKLYVNGVEEYSTPHQNATVSYSQEMVIKPVPASISLFRISATAPSPEQIKKIYNDEKHLFQENAKATLYGTSDAVTALAYDDDTELLHAGTSAGRSVFQGLRRIDNTTDAVGNAISASNGMVAED